MSRNKRQLRNLLIDTSFQVRYTVLVIVVSVLIFLVLGWLYRAEWEAGNRILSEINPIVERSAAPDADAQLREVEALSAGLPADAEERENLAALEEETGQALDRRGRTQLAILVAAVGLLVVLLAAISIWMSHKAAGPVYAMRLFIRAAREGQWSRIRPLRKGDHFTYLAVEFGALVGDIKKRHADDLLALDECAAALDAGDPAAARRLVDRLREGKTAYLGEAGRT
jgi:hypothetical protein